ncbi:MAG TPA: D-alanyl-D-alanine carboxypeptidase/D-alanyl-D-alanine-endopeptidase [Methylotenera sp.]|nr:D-alanyl-D-alanine carboxypeptidase/D-alanyl-D-alanine-endopeptidase [Methylotenera sp.]
MNKLLLILCFCTYQIAYAEQSDIELLSIEPSDIELARSELPDSVNIALQKAGVPAESVSVYVQALAEQPAKLSPPLLTHLSSVALNPASTMKLLTSYAGLSLLGPAYRWKTEVYTDGAVNNGVLNGNLYLKGYGDPNFMTADFWRLLNSLRQLGIKEIKGDLVIDNSYFANNTQSTESFDGEPLRAYNALPSALAINLKASSFRFDSDANQVTITQEPNLPEIKIVNLLKVSNAKADNKQTVTAQCSVWRNTLGYDVKSTGDMVIVTFNGTYAPHCKEKYLELLAIDEKGYTLHLFRKLWLELGGSFNGKLLTKNVPTNATKLIQQNSKTLAQILPEMNKWSNNLMARQLLLTLAAQTSEVEKSAVSATEDNGALAVERWLNSIGLRFHELVIENGSGLSRIERISAEHMGQMLVNAYYSPVMSELMGSLPILAVDGTMLKRMKDSNLQGKAHLKTGSINGAFSLAGYALDGEGQRYVVVFMTNHTNAALTKPAQEALLEWVYAQ